METGYEPLDVNAAHEQYIHMPSHLKERFDHYGSDLITPSLTAWFTQKNPDLSREVILRYLREMAVMMGGYTEHFLPAVALLEALCPEDCARSHTHLNKAKMLERKRGGTIDSEHYQRMAKVTRSLGLADAALGFLHGYKDQEPGATLNDALGILTHILREHMTIEIAAAFFEEFTLEELEGE